MFTKENFKEMYEKEIEELSLVESAINKLEFQMNGKSDVHKNVLSAFEHYANSELRTTLKGGGFLFSLQRTDLQI